MWRLVVRLGMRWFGGFVIVVVGIRMSWLSVVFVIGRGDGVLDVWLSRDEALWLLGVLPESPVKDRLRMRIDDFVRRG